MKKRTESQLVTATLRYLQCLENLGRVIWCDRLNSGSYKVGKYFIRGCRPGTPDIYAILNDRQNTTLWIECKTATGKQSPEQITFGDMICELKNHRYIVIRSVDDLERFLEGGI